MDGQRHRLGVYGASVPEYWEKVEAGEKVPVPAGYILKVEEGRPDLDPKSALPWRQDRRSTPAGLVGSTTIIEPVEAASEGLWVPQDVGCPGLAHGSIFGLKWGI